MQQPLVPVQEIYLPENYLGDSVIWNNIPAWTTVGDSGADQRTPDLSNLLQKVIDRSGWVSGNAVLFGMVDPAVLSIFRLYRKHREENSRIL